MMENELRRLKVKPTEWPDVDDLGDIGMDEYLRLKEKRRKRLALRFSPRKSRKREEVRNG
jgi:hypothetical protein